MTIKIPIKTFEALAKTFSEGFEREVRSIAEFDLEHLSIDAELYQEIRLRHPRKYPDLLDKLKSLSMSASGWAESGFKMASNSEVKGRLAICKGCELWDQSGFAGTGRCQKCGCSTQAKLRMETSKCPENKW